jgi:hypothetical protein
MRHATERSICHQILQAIDEISAGLPSSDCNWQVRSKPEKASGLAGSAVLMSVGHRV